MALGKLFKRLVGGGGPAPQLVVEGVIVESGRHTPRTHLGPKQPAEEAWFGLEIAAAQLSDGRPQPVASVVPAEFSGGVDLLERFAVGQRVRITCSTATGREIAAIEAIG